jgi:hypothetical protein
MILGVLIHITESLGQQQHGYDVNVDLESLREFLAGQSTLMLELRERSNHLLSRHEAPSRTGLA